MTLLAALAIITFAAAFHVRQTLGGRVAGAFALIVLMPNCSAPEADGNNATAPPGGASKVFPGAADPWAPEDYPQMVERVGPANFQRGVRLFPRIGKAVASDAECDLVYHVGLSDTSTPEALQFYADCENGHRRRFTEAEAQALPE